MQQSIMNLGILAVQGLVNSFGTTIMASFAAAVKIDAFAYLPVQDFGNAFSIFIAQNYGAKKTERIKKGIRTAVLTSVAFSLLVSLIVFIFAKPLMGLFIDAGETAVIAEGARYLRIEGSFYFMIGILFLLYGLYVRWEDRECPWYSPSYPSASASLSPTPCLPSRSSASSVSGGPCRSDGFCADTLGIGYYLIRRKNLLKE